MDATKHFGTEAEALGGAFTLAQTRWPQGARARLARAQNVAAARANALYQAVDLYGVEAQLEAQAGFDEAIAGYRAAMLALFGLEDAARAPGRAEVRP